MLGRQSLNRKQDLSRDIAPQVVTFYNVVILAFSSLTFIVKHSWEEKANLHSVLDSITFVSPTNKEVLI